VKARWFVPLAIFVVLALLLGVGLKLNPREVPSPYIGKPAPAFTLPLLAEPSRTLSAADLKGQVWVLNVWASWCAPCREEHPLLVALAKELKVPLYGLNYKDDARNAQEWLLRLGDPYTASARDADGRVAIDYGVYGVPETFVVDREGIVRYKHVGPLTREVWLRDVQPLLQRLQG
jgi:cytochrome c biogenesis protein CcmG/thiol:disulfide interchange protein DsbE